MTPFMQRLNRLFPFVVTALVFPAVFLSWEWAANLTRFTVWLFFGLAVLYFLADDRHVEPIATREALFGQRARTEKHVLLVIRVVFFVSGGWFFTAAADLVSAFLAHARNEAALEAAQQAEGQAAAGEGTPHE